MPEFELHEAFKEPGVEQYKKRGNEAFKEGNWDEAIKNYNKAISLDPSMVALYSNRAAVHSSKGDHESALADANRCIEQDPTFLKGYSRKGKALFDLNEMDEAETAYKAGLAVDATNEGCSKGVADIQAIREAARQSARRQASQSSPLGQAKRYVSSLGEKLKKASGLGGRMQIYILLFGGYYLYQYYTKNKTAGTDQTTSAGETVVDDRDRADGSVAKWQRGFTESDSGWLSYLGSGSQGESILLMLHSTSRSANSEYGKAFPKLLAKPLPTSGFRVLVPDRPCHGYSPCPSNGEPKDGAKWLNNLLADRGQPKYVAMVASGREAATYTLALVRRRKKPANVLLIRPQAAAPRRGVLTTASDVSAWLEQQAASQAYSMATARAAADAAWWGAKEVSEDPDEPEPIKVGPMPDGCAVSIFYAEDDAEDEELKTGLEEQGVKVTVRSSLKTSALMDEVVKHSRQTLASKASDIDADEEELDDRL